jgi:hypothetical protein
LETLKRFLKLLNELMGRPVKFVAKKGIASGQYNTKF